MKLNLDNIYEDFYTKVLIVNRIAIFFETICQVLSVKSVNFKR